LSFCTKKQKLETIQGAVSTIAMVRGRRWAASRPPPPVAIRAGAGRLAVGFAQELSHTHEHTMPARETMNTRIFGDERLYLDLLFHWTWQKKTVEYRGYLSARGHT